MPTPAQLAKSFQALESAKAGRSALGTVERAAQFVSSGDGAAGQKSLEFIKRRATQTAAEALNKATTSPGIVNDAIKVAKASAEVAAETGTKAAAEVGTKVAPRAGFGARAGLRIAKELFTHSGKGLSLKSFPVVAAISAAGAAGLGYTLNHFAQNSVDDAHEDHMRLLRKYGLKVDRGSEESGPDVGGLGDAAGWYTGTGDHLLSRAASLEGDPNWTHPVSDMDTLKVTTPDGSEISEGSNTQASMKRERDLFIASGRMDNEWRKQPHLELLPKSDWPKPGEKAKPFLPPVFVPPWARKKK